MAQIYSGLIWTVIFGYFTCHGSLVLHITYFKGMETTKRGRQPFLQVALIWEVNVYIKNLTWQMYDDDTKSCRNNRINLLIT